ncbi:hypothetical protein U4L49_03540, partial [Klebsiella pneumoniae]|nr:hypothetical protein [Klebsiella pneumoniae]
MPGKLLRSVLIGLLVGGLLLALMPSLRQWQLAPTTQNDTADDSPASKPMSTERNNFPGMMQISLMNGQAQH